jgi:hypothetical protein
MSPASASVPVTGRVTASGSVTLLTLPPGHDPALDHPRPDMELLVWQTVQSLGGVTSWSYSVIEHDPPGWLSTTYVQVDCRAGSRHDASRRADAARQAICALPWGSSPLGRVCRVVVEEGPFWLPDPDGAPRYVARYALTAHPAA